MGSDWSIYGFVFVMAAILMVRLDRLGKQLEAIGVSIRADFARTEEERSEIINDWKEGKKQATRDAWLFWIFWSVVGAVGLIWTVVAHK
jgi:hypothetical protein